MKYIFTMVNCDKKLKQKASLNYFNLVGLVLVELTSLISILEDILLVP